ncbi:L-threonylcarbamoyladenylate synthase [Bacillus mesophilus]|uniref:Threonylcarbamoyl-AMP synthase n=1 Tax=Bacillus mesophilus TaxID=1808955 RepID=A0A6M0Q9D5_9BACI|nr:L-threonylcarbamoyladenylate synthase [Bacillus mesophilus]MBM7662448.1 L-threonylcarbamoyladenylate synthase [Bacillus mesophilus]NEY72925.1 threonylcarbamoyl-AMP synthase [Bacillus mesophilus]
METKKWVVDMVDNLSTSCPQIKEAAQLLRENEVVAFPTETVYGLGGNATSTEAVDKIFKAKGRPSDNPLIVHIADEEQLKDLVTDITETAKKLIDLYWPGPLTLILPAKVGAVSESVTAGLSTVAVRMPDHPVALALLKETGLPLAAPSANLSGKPSPTSANHVWNDLCGRIAGLVDGGVTGVGVESTVVDCTEEIPIVLRPGGITKEQIVQAVGKVGMDPALQKQDETPKSPGMKYTHYAPNAPLFIVKGSTSFLQTLVDVEMKEGKRVGILATDETVNNYRANVKLSCGSRTNLSTVANRLYEALRGFDEAELDLIYSESFSTVGIGEAIMNRLEKAAGHQIIVEK